MSHLALTPVNFCFAIFELLLDVLAPMPNAYFIYLLCTRQDLHNNLRVQLGCFSGVLVAIALTRVPTELCYLSTGVLYIPSLHAFVVVHEIGVMYVRSVIIPLTMERVLATVRSRDYEQRRSCLFGVLTSAFTLIFCAFPGFYISGELNSSSIRDGVISFADNFYEMFRVIDVALRLIVCALCFVIFVGLLLYNQRCYAFERCPNKHNLVQRYQFSENVRSSRQLLVIGTIIFICNLLFDAVYVRISLDSKVFPVEYSQCFDLILALALNLIPALAIATHPSMARAFRRHTRRLLRRPRRRGDESVGESCAESRGSASLSAASAFALFAAGGSPRPGSRASTSGIPCTIVRASCTRSKRASSAAVAQSRPSIVLTLASNTSSTLNKAAATDDDDPNPTTTETGFAQPSQPQTNDGGGSDLSPLDEQQPESSSASRKGSVGHQPPPQQPQHLFLRKKDAPTKRPSSKQLQQPADAAPLRMPTRRRNTDADANGGACGRIQADSASTTTLMLCRASATSVPQQGAAQQQKRRPRLSGLHRHRSLSAGDGQPRALLSGRPLIVKKVDEQQVYFAELYKSWRRGYKVVEEAQRRQRYRLMRAEKRQSGTGTPTSSIPTPTRVLSVSGELQLLGRTPEKKRGAATPSLGKIDRGRSLIV